MQFLWSEYWIHYEKFSSNWCDEKFTKAYEGYEPLAHDPEVEVVYVGAINTTHLQ